MAELNDRQHDLLREVLAGDLAADAQEVRQAAEESPLFAARLEEMLATDGWLAGAEEEMSAILAAASDLRDAPGEAGLHEFVLGQAEQAEPRAARPGKRWRSQISAAAALLLVAFGLWWGFGRDRAEVWMGDGSLELLHPIGEVQEFFPVRWSGKLSPGATFEIKIWNATQAGPGDFPLLHKQEFEEHEWTPSESEQGALEDQIVIELSLIASDGTTAESIRQASSRSDD